jgi:tetratricopeptide (TPR) repeat protein
MPVRIFLSTVSDEFRDYRDQLRRDLTRHNVEVKVQEDFKDLGTVTLDKLDVYVTNCHAVVHLVGDMTGAAAKPESTRSLLAKYPDLPDRLPPLRQPLADGLAISYTQWEAWLALYHDKLLVIAKADEVAPRWPQHAPTDDSQVAQQEHLARLSAVERYPAGTFNSPDSLAKLVFSGAILELLVTADNRRIKIRTVVVALAALLGMFAVYLLLARHERIVESATIAKKNEETAAITKSTNELTKSANEKLTELTKFLTSQLIEPDVPIAGIRLSDRFHAQAAAGREQAVGAALTNIATGAAAGDTRLQQALDRLKAGNIEDATKLLRTIADEAQARIQEDSKQAAAALRNLGAIAGLRDPKSAREAYARAVMLDPDDREALYWHGWLQILSGNLGLADHDLNRLLQVSVAAHDDRSTYRAYLRLGEVSRARGNFKEAREYEDHAYDVAKLNAERSPNDQEWQRDLAVSYNKIGDVQVAQGDLPEALKSYRDGLAIADRLAKSDPGNALWQRDLGVSYNNIGNVLLVAQGNLPEVLKLYRDGLAIADRWAKAEPSDAEWQRNLGVSYNNIGNVLVAQGDLAGALKSYRDSLAIFDRLAKSDPGNAGWQRHLSASYERIGNVLVAQGNVPEALKSYRGSLAITDRLAKSDPGNAERQYDLGISNERFGDVFRAQRNFAEALKSYQAEQEIISRLAKSDPDTASWQHVLSASYEKIGDMLMAQGNVPEALKSYRGSLAIMERLAKSDPSNALWQHDLSISYEKIGNVQVKQDNLAEALKSYQADFAIMDRLAKADPGNAEWQRGLSVSYSKLAVGFSKAGDKAKALDALRQGRTIMVRMTSLAPDNAVWKNDLAWFDGQIAELDRTKARSRR